MKQLYFIRHGESTANVGDFMATADTPLTSHGIKQAQLAGKHAKKLNIDYIVSSPFIRAYDTAKIIAEVINYPVNKIHINKLFVERDFSALEGKAWSDDSSLDGITDIETVDDLLKRSRLAYDFLHSLDFENILVVAHGAFGRALRQHVLNIPYTNKADTPLEHLISNAEIIRWI